jgi:transposase
MVTLSRSVYLQSSERMCDIIIRDFPAKRRRKKLVRTSTARINVSDRESRSCEESRRLEELPGVGPIVATALVAEVGDWKEFTSGRSLAAWIGLVPRQHSTGGKERLGSEARQSTFALAAGCRRHGCHPICAPARHEV